MSLETWIVFCATETVLCLTPGPAVLFVVSTALARGARPGFAGALGVLAANVAYFAISATGVAAVILASHDLFGALKWAGAAYLVWMGLGMLRGRGRGGPEAVAPAARRALLRGVVVQGANPKALMFFVALLPQFIDARGSVSWQVLVLGTSSVLIELTVLALYVAAAVRARRTASEGWLATRLERVGGAFLIAAGGRLALGRAE